MINVSISKEIKKIFDSYKQVNKNDIEAFGLLIGTRSIDGQLLTIKLVTKPEKKDIRKRNYYKMKSKHHVEILKKAFEDSNFKEVYLGTWHTHPEENPTPSLVDIINWKKQYKKNKYLFDNMIFIIVGQKEALCWSVGKNGNLKLRDIKIN